MSPNRFFYGWVVVCASSLILCFGFGTFHSLGVFLTPIEESMKWNRTEISTVALVGWLAMAIGSLVGGALSDRLGTRAVAVAGGFLLGLGLVLSSQITALWHLYITFGLLVGLSVGTFYASLTSTVTKWFTAKRGLAVALVSAGVGLGMFVIAPLTRWLINLYEWRTAILLIGDLAWLVIIPAAVLIRNTPGEVGASAMGGRAPEPGRDFSRLDIWRAPQFWVIGLTHFLCCAAHSGPIFHMVAHAMDRGIAKMAAATLLGVSGLSSIAGRIGCGVIADRFSTKRTLVVALGLQATTVFLYLFADTVTGLYVLAAVFGVVYGGVMPLYALLTREYFGEKLMGTAYGGVLLLQALGMGLGSFAGGWSYDRFGSYTWLFATSSAIGVMAAVLALTFRNPVTRGGAAQALDSLPVRP